jgi:hypothetical protein
MLNKRILCGAREKYVEKGARAGGNNVVLWPCVVCSAIHMDFYIVE